MVIPQEILEGIIVFAVAFIVAFAMVPVSKKIAHAIGAIDYPGNRRVNVKPIPRCGGIAMYTGFMAACFVLFMGVLFFGWTIPNLYTVHGIDYPVMIIGVTIIFLVGLLDDITALKPLVKFAGQILAALVVALSGVTIDTVVLMSNTYFDLGIFNIPITVLYFVCFANVINLIDGLDGLAAGITAIVMGCLLYLVAARGSVLLTLLALAVIGVCLAFLRFNFHPASIFMGDSGALFLGMMIGIVSLAGVIRSQSFIVMLVPIVIAGVPILDTLSAIIRRTRQGQSIGTPDRGHVHHRLIDSGMSQSKAVLILYACTAGLALAGISLELSSGWLRWLVLVSLFIIIALVVKRFHLFSPVLEHYYDNRGHFGIRRPRSRFRRHAAAEAAQKAGEASAADAGTAAADADATGADAAAVAGAGEAGTAAADAGEAAPSTPDRTEGDD